MSRGKKITYAFLGACLLMFDVNTWAGSQPTALGVVLTVLMVSGSVLLGWCPRFAGVLVVVCGMADELLSAGVLVSSIALQLVVVDWLSRRWDAAVAGTVITHTLIGAASAEDPMWFLQAQALLMSIAVIVGMALRQYERRFVELMEREARLRLELENEELRVRSEIALALHDSVATDLAQVVVTGQSLAQDLPAGYERDRARAMVDAGQQAMTHLRGIMGGLRRSSSAVRDEQVDLAATVSECRRMLESRGLGLEVDASMPWDELLRGVELPARRLLSLVLREGAVNALKYAPDGSMVRMEVERVEGRVALEVSSARGADDGPADPAQTVRRRGLSGGTGLSGLAMRAARFGGKVVYGPAGDRWLVGATVPVRSRAQVDNWAPDPPRLESTDESNN